MTALPSYIDPMLWAAFVEQRHSMKKVPFSPQAQKLVVMKLMRLHADGWDANAMLESSAINGWRDVYPKEKIKQEKTKDPALAKIEADRAMAAPMPESIREKLRALRA